MMTFSELVLLLLLPPELLPLPQPPLLHQLLVNNPSLATSSKWALPKLLRPKLRLRLKLKLREEEPSTSFETTLNSTLSVKWCSRTLTFFSLCFNSWLRPTLKSYNASTKTKPSSFAC